MLAGICITVMAIVAVLAAGLGKLLLSFGALVLLSIASLTVFKCIDPEGFIVYLLWVLLHLALGALLFLTYSPS